PRANDAAEDSQVPLVAVGPLEAELRSRAGREEPDDREAEHTARDLRVGRPEELHHSFEPGRRRDRLRDAEVRPHRRMILELLFDRAIDELEVRLGRRW